MDQRIKGDTDSSAICNHKNDVFDCHWCKLWQLSMIHVVVARVSQFDNSGACCTAHSFLLLFRLSELTLRSHIVIAGSIRLLLKHGAS